MYFQVMYQKCIHANRFEFELVEFQTEYYLENEIPFTVKPINTVRYTLLSMYL